MTTDSPALEKEKGRWFSFFAKLAFFLAVLLAVIIAVLSSLGGNSDVLKSSIEEFLGGRLGGVAKVEKLNRMTFYPYMGADFEGVKVVRRDNESQILLSADHITVAMGFWDITLSTNKVKAFNIQNLYAVPGVIMEKGITISQMAIIDEGDKAYVRGDGKIGPVPFTFQAPVEKFGSGKNKKYGFSETRLFSATLGDVSFSGSVINHNADSMSITDLKIEQAGKVKLSGQLDFYYGGEYRLKIKGDLEMADGSRVKPDILFGLGGEQPTLEGNLDFQPLSQSDFSAYRDYITLYDTVKSALGRKDAKPFSGNILISSGNAKLSARDVTRELQGLRASGDIITLDCVLADVALDNGAAQIKNFVIKTPQSDATGTGSYDFASDTLELQPAGADENAAALIADLGKRAALGADHPCMGSAASKPE